MSNLVGAGIAIATVVTAALRWVGQRIEGRSADSLIKRTMSTFQDLPEDWEEERALLRAEILRLIEEMIKDRKDRRRNYYNIFLGTTTMLLGVMFFVLGLTQDSWHGLVRVTVGYPVAVIVLSVGLVIFIDGAKKAERSPAGWVATQKPDQTRKQARIQTRDGA